VERVLGPLLAGLGAFLLALAVLLPTVVVPRFEQVPLDQYTVSQAEGTGNYLNTETFEFERDDDITITRVVRGDVEASDDDVAVFDSSQTFEGSRMTEPLSVITERVRFDRGSGIGVGGTGDRPNHEGAYAFKLPFNVEKTDYLWHDATAARAYPVSFERETEIRGLKVYEFRGSVPEVKRQELGVPAELIGGTGTTLVFVEEIYENPERSILVEPRTGIVVSTTASPRNFFRPIEIGGSSTGVETDILDVTVTATEETQAELVNDARDAKSSLDLYGRTLPIVLGVLGLLLLFGGLVLAAIRARRPAARGAREREPVSY
jgi:hypothetical protein